MEIQSKLFALFGAALVFSATQVAGAAGKAAPRPAPKTSDSSKKCACDDAGHPQLRPVIGIGAGFNWEDSDRLTEEERGGNVIREDEEEELVSDGFVSLQAWALFPMFLDRLYVGGGIAWHNKYAIKPADQDEDDESSYEIGQMLALSVQTEFFVPEVISKLNVFLGVRGGGLVAFPGGELSDDLKGLDRSGHSVTPDLPRLGGFISPHVGVSWPLSPKLRIRTDMSAQFSSITLWDGSAKAAGITSRSSSVLKTLRYVWMIGPELVL